MKLLLLIIFIMAIIVTLAKVFGKKGKKDDYSGWE